MQESKSKKYLDLYEIKEHKRSLRNAILNKDLDLWDAAMSLEAICQMLDGYELMEAHYLAIFGTKRKSDHDRLDFVDDVQTRFITHQEHKKI